MSRQNEKKLRLVPFEPEHFKRLQLRAEDAADLAGIELAGLFEAWRGGTTLLYDGEPASIFGAQRSGTSAVLWAVTGCLTDTLPLATTRIARLCILDLLADGVLRIEAHCHAKNQRSLKWLTRALGFKLEGLMRRAGPNRQDRYLLSIIIEDLQGGAR